MNQDTTDQGYLGDIMPELDGPSPADQIIPADQLWQRGLNLIGIDEGLDLVRFDDEARARLGNPSPLSPGEQSLFAGVADFIGKFAPQLKKLGMNTDHMGPAFDVAVCLEQAGEADAQVTGGAHTGIVVLVGQMTGNVAEIQQEAATQKAQNPDQVTELSIDTAMKPIEQLQAQVLKAAAGVKSRGAAARSQKDADVTAALAKQKAKVNREKLSAEPLPDVSQPVKKPTRKPARRKATGKTATKKPTIRLGTGRRKPPKGPTGTGSGTPPSL